MESEPLIKIEQTDSPNVESLDNELLKDAKLVIHSDENESHVEVPELVSAKLSEEVKTENLLGMLNGEISIKGDMAGTMNAVNEFSQS